MNTAAAALAPRPSRAPRGFVAADRCGTCDGRGEVLTSQVDGDGEIVFDGEGFEVETTVTCDDCDGVGWAKPVVEVLTPAQRRDQRIAEHAEFVAEFGPGASCGGAYCRCPR